MHPAASVIFFTVSSGAGYGLLAFAGIAALLGQFEHGRAAGLWGATLALLLITAGLLSSTLHLGRPERAWRAMAQWRTSWLSREAVIALLTYLPAAGLWLCLAAGVVSGPMPAVAGALSVVGALGTVICTGMIYAVLRPIREWNTPWTVPGYVMMSAATGAAIWTALWVALGPGTGHATTIIIAVSLVGLAAATRYCRERWLEAAGPAATRESATGLSGRGSVRVLDPPHTGTNYLLEEMGYQVGRKHRARLARLMWGLGFAAPAGLLLCGLLWWPAVALAAPVMLLGIAVERWLFFATATHTVTLYYR